ncbi:MAG: flagellar motor switch protein FliN [Kangiella sp.]|nr:MAG: flagellar motor switch protein FliN [Kangiella sp.]
MSDENNENQDAGDDWGAAMEEQNEVDATKVSPDNLTESQAIEGSLQEGKLDVILDIPVSLSMEVGRTQIAIRNLLQLTQGSVVELDRLAGEPLDVKVNGTLIAHGEVVVINEKYGIRLTDVMSPQERIKKLS